MCFVHSAAASRDRTCLWPSWASWNAHAASSTRISYRPAPHYANTLLSSKSEILFNRMKNVKVIVEIMLRPTVSRTVCLGVKSLLGPQTRFLLLSDSCGFVDVRCPLWREDGSVIYRGHRRTTESEYVCMYVCMYKGWARNPALAPRPSMIYCASPFNKPFINPTLRMKCRTLFMGAS
jgi:hypothetical protein